ncbi:hypothetical protein [Clostridium sp.]|uniref:hypothetical protein n=1 Tax=Clostridium sp. TaxID=1506 RepID=UPI001B44EBD4|nr:hypothetical protein [Clostridium sp.]MBP3917422.1 hypothetical protein [Clostridium sp.]
MIYGNNDVYKFPLGQGRLYKANDNHFLTFTQKVEKLRNALKRKNVLIAINYCCGVDAANNLYQFNRYNYIFIKESVYESLKGENGVIFPFYISYSQKPYEVIEALNKSGFSCVYDGDLDNPIIVLPDLFDLREYVNFKES